MTSAIDRAVAELFGGSHGSRPAAAATQGVPLKSAKKQKQKPKVSRKIRRVCKPESLSTPTTSVQPIYGDESALLTEEATVIEERRQRPFAFLDRGPGVSDCFVPPPLVEASELHLVSPGTKVRVALIPEKGGRPRVVALQFVD